MPSWRPRWRFDIEIQEPGEKIELSSSISISLLSLYLSFLPLYKSRNLSVCVCDRSSSSHFRFFIVSTTPPLQGSMTNPKTSKTAAPAPPVSRKTKSTERASVTTKKEIDVPSSSTRNKASAGDKSLPNEAEAEHSSDSDSLSDASWARASEASEASDSDGSHEPEPASPQKNVCSPNDDGSFTSYDDEGQVIRCLATRNKDGLPCKNTKLYTDKRCKYHTKSTPTCRGFKKNGEPCNIRVDLDENERCKYHPEKEIRCKGIAESTGERCKIKWELNADGYCKYHNEKADRCRGIAASTGEQCRIKWDLDRDGYCTYHVNHKPQK